MQKALALLMAVFVLLLAVMMPVQAQTYEHRSDLEQGLIQDASSYTDALDLSLLPKPLPKIGVFFFVLPKLWSALLDLLAPKCREYRAVFLQLFIQKINFVFVSTQAP